MLFVVSCWVILLIGGWLVRLFLVFLVVAYFVFRRDVFGYVVVIDLRCSCRMRRLLGIVVLSCLLLVRSLVCGVCGCLVG